MAIPDPLENSNARENTEAEEVAAPGEESAGKTLSSKLASHELDASAAEEDDSEFELSEEIPSRELFSTLQAVIQRHSGPLPSPEVLAAYKNVDARVLDWVLDSATGSKRTGTGVTKSRCDNLVGGRSSRSFSRCSSFSWEHTSSTSTSLPKASR